MLLSLRKNGLTSLFKEVRVFKVKGFSAFFRHFSWKWCHENCLKIDRFKNQGIFRDFSG